MRIENVRKLLNQKDLRKKRKGENQDLKHRKMSLNLYIGIKVFLRRLDHIFLDS